MLEHWCIESQSYQGRMQDFWRVGQIYKGGFVLLILPNFHKNPHEYKKGNSSKTLEPPAVTVPFLTASMLD